MSDYALSVLPAFTAAASVNGGKAPAYLERHLRPAIDAARDDRGIVADMDALDVAAVTESSRW